MEIKCNHTNCVRRAEYFEGHNNTGWCKECMPFQLGFERSGVSCDKCKEPKMIEFCKECGQEIKED